MSQEPENTANTTDNAFSRRRVSEPGIIQRFPGIAFQCLNDQRWTMKFVSPGTEQLTGYRPEALIGNSEVSFAELIHPDDQERVWRQVQSALQRRQPYEIKYRLLTKSGEQKWVLEKGHGVSAEDEELLNLEGFIFDISDQVDLQGKIDHFIEIVENINVGLLVYHLEDSEDDRSLRLVTVNPSVETLLGVTADKLVGRRIDEIFPGLREQDVPRIFAEVVRTNEPREVREFEYGDESVPDKVWTFKAFPLPGDSVGVAFDDITDQKRLERQFLQAQKLEAVGRLAAGVAHDFNNLLTVIMGFSELMRDHVTPESPLSRYLSTVTDTSERAARLVEQLLLFSRDRPQEMEVLNLNECIEDNLKMLSRMIGADVQVDFYPDPDLWKIQASKAQLEQILFNLAVNSRDAMPGAGRISLETANMVLGKEDSQFFADLDAGDYVLLVVADTGCGISKEILEKVLDPFFSTKEPGKGTGLGLSTVHAIVKKHGGELKLYSEPGKGTTIRLYFPRNDKPAGPSRINDVRESDLQGTETVLVAEDEEGVRELLQQSLEARGYHVLPAASAEEAETLFSENMESIDLLLTDIVMPDEDGSELFNSLRKRKPVLKALFISGHSDQAVRNRLELEPDQPFLQKPFGPMKLLAKVREVLDEEAE